MAALHPCAWKDVGNGVYTRHLDTREQMIIRQIESTPQQGEGEFAMVNECLAYTITLYYTLSDPEKIFREAWLSLHYDHPSLAAAHKDEIMIYDLRDNPTTIEWATKTFIVHDDPHSTALEYLEHIPGTRAIILHFFPKTKEIMLQASHEHIDGIGILATLRNLLGYASRPSNPGRAQRTKDWVLQNLDPPLDIAAHSFIPERITADVWHSTKSMLETFWEMSSDPVLLLSEPAGAASPDPGNSDQRPAAGTGRPRLCRISFSADVTSKLITAAKLHGVTIRDLTHSATIVALRAHADKRGCGNGKNWTGGIARCVRELCQPPFDNAALHPVFNSFVGGLVWVNSTHDIWEASRQLRDHREALAADKHVLARMKSIQTLMTGSEGKAKQQRTGHTRNQSAILGPVQYAGMGPMDRHFPGHIEEGSIQVLDLWYASQKCSAQVMAGCYSLRGKLWFGLSYNAKYYAEEVMAEYADRIRSILCKVAAGEL